MNITVYLGASEVRSDELNNAATELGAWIAKSNHTLIYGGSKMGLMGKLALSAINGGAHVIGIEPQMFMDKELQLDSLPELIVTENMSERKTRMIELGDAFIAFPGGTGTLEEISEIISQSTLGLTNAPCILYNLNGYYDHLKAQFEKMIEMELSTKERQQNIYFADTLTEIEEIIKATGD